MTRKRFIKLMMSRGYSRNEAVEMASAVSQYGSYDRMYGCVLGLPSVIRKISMGLAAVCDAIAAAFSSFAASARRLANG